MHLAILMTNTDESAFAQRHPKDGEKFRHLVHSVRPDWRLTSFDVKDGVFPSDINQFSGAIITGSPASVHDPDAWVGHLQDLIRTIYDAGIPMFGACYGHQAIARALGGEVGPNPTDWIFGLTTSQVVKAAEWMGGLPERFHQYGAHNEAVTQLPDGAETLTVAKDCAITGYRIGDLVYTTQNHPEMSETFFQALLDEYEDKLPSKVVATARSSLVNLPDTTAYAETIARFFEMALSN